MTQPQTTVRIVSLNDREIMVRDLGDMQKMLLARELRQLSRDIDGHRKLLSIATIMDLLESVIINPEDVEYVKDQIVSHGFDLPDMLKFIKPKDTTPEPPRVRRGRPRKSA